MNAQAVESSRPSRPGSVAAATAPISVAASRSRWSPAAASPRLPAVEAGLRSGELAPIEIDVLAGLPGRRGRAP